MAAEGLFSFLSFPSSSFPLFELVAAGASGWASALEGGGEEGSRAAGLVVTEPLKEAAGTAAAKEGSAGFSVAAGRGMVAASKTCSVVAVSFAAAAAAAAASVVAAFAFASMLKSAS